MVLRVSNSLPDTRTTDLLPLLNCAELYVLAADAIQYISSITNPYKLDLDNTGSSSATDSLTLNTSHTYWATACMLRNPHTKVSAC